MVSLSRLYRAIVAVILCAAALGWGGAAHAQNCSPAASQGTAPASWETYCWLNLANYNDTTARSASGQNLSFALPDGSTLSFNARVTGGTTTAYNAVAAPSWSGAAFGNTAFIGIPGRPVLYTAAAGTRLITLSGISITPPPGAAAVTAYAFIVADAESSNEGEALRYTTNGSAWSLLDSVPPISGSTFPAISGVGSSSVNITGVGGTVGAYIVGSNSPTTVTVETVAGGLQGVMFAVRFATIRLRKTIVGPRINSADQFRFEIVGSSGGTVMASGTTSGTGNGPFSATPLSLASGVALTVREVMASGSVSTLAQYASSLTCTNTAGATRPGLPNNVAATEFNLGTLQFGEALLCTFTNGAHPRVRLRKALGSGGRRFAGDQFTVRISQGTTVVAQATTSGTSGTVTGGDTGVVQLLAGQAYTLDEIAAGTGDLRNYTATMACTNASSGTGTTLPTVVPGTITPNLGDLVTCTITNTRRSTAVLDIQKTSSVISDPVNGTANPKAMPGAIVEYAITVRNIGASTVDSSTIVLVDRMPSNMAFATGTPVTFTNGTTASGLNTFNAATMVTYSSQASGGAPFTYTPTGAFDPQVRGIRIAPTGTMSAATATTQPSFTIRFRARMD
ncbi:MAG: CshA/CshB family fibrillar adhesin-related protein [Novosphingobium meiothermophilum]